MSRIPLYQQLCKESVRQNERSSKMRRMQSKPESYLWDWNTPVRCYESNKTPIQSVAQHPHTSLTITQFQHSWAENPAGQTNGMFNTHLDSSKIDSRTSSILPSTTLKARIQLSHQLSSFFIINQQTDVEIDFYLKFHVTWFMKHGHILWLVREAITCLSSLRHFVGMLRYLFTDLGTCFEYC